MVGISRAWMMSVGIIKNTLTATELEALERAPLEPKTEQLNALDEKIGFELGWDYGRFLGWHPDEEQNHHFLGGFELARDKTHPPHTLDRYTRKWLQLRYGAWRRCRVFDEAVTPAFLQKIDRTTCPILGIRLTHSTGELTDWSVDRLNNFGGYAVGNLAVMSTQANAAKGSLTFAEIDELSNLDFPCAGLKPIHWKRLASLLTGAYSVIQKEELLYPLCLVPPPYVPMNLFQEFQLVLARELGKAKDTALLQKFYKICADRSLKRRLNKLITKLIDCRPANAPIMETWLQEPVFNALLDFYQKLPPPALERLRICVETALGSEQVSSGMRESWAIETRGFG